MEQVITLHLCKKNGWFGCFVVLILDIKGSKTMTELLHVKKEQKGWGKLLVAARRMVWGLRLIMALV